LGSGRISRMAWVGVLTYVAQTFNQGFGANIVPDY
jgi:hypothetical protein